jgi:cobalamin biosynthesis protein CobD/CbiB
LPSFNQILGGLVVLSAIVMAAHEIWVYNRPHGEGFPVSSRRLRRRLTGVAIILVIVAMLTWAGYASEAALKLAFYGTALLAAILLLGVAFSDLRETSRQFVREQLEMDPEELRQLMEDPEMRDLVGKLQGGNVSEGELAELGRHLRDRRAPRAE